jgi:hypothetical protein
MKKAMAPTMIATLILALIFTGVGIKLVQKIDQGTSKGYDKQLCKQSVILNSKGRIPVAEREEFPLDCPTRYVTFYKDKATTESRNFESNLKIKCGNLKSRKDKECYLTQANRVISKLLFDCWDQFAAGRLMVLNAWDQNRQCVLCARFEFAPEVQKAFKESVGNREIAETDFFDKKNKKIDFTLDEFMRTHNDPMHKISYYEFTMDPVDAFKLPYYDYSLTEPFGIIFKAVNKDKAEAIAEGVWEFIKKHRLEIPFTNININILHDPDAKNEPEMPEFVNIMELLRYNEVINQCDSLA